MRDIDRGTEESEAGHSDNRRFVVRKPPTPPETEDEWFPNLATKFPTDYGKSRHEKSRVPSTTRPGAKSQAVKLLKGWGIRFKGSAKEDPEVFLDRLEACVEDAGEPLENLLSAIPCVLDDRVLRSPIPSGENESTRSATVYRDGK